MGFKATLILGEHGALFSLSQAPRPVMYLLINALAFFVFLYLLVVFRDRKRRGGLPYPPGPPSWPIIGNLLDIPADAPWTAYADMSKKYGRRYILGNTSLPQPNLNPRSKAMLFVFAFLIRSSLCCVRYQPSRISLRSAQNPILIGPLYQSSKCTFSSIIIRNHPPR
jgi:hypothetical protein